VIYEENMLFIMICIALIWGLIRFFGWLSAGEIRTGTIIDKYLK